MEKVGELQEIELGLEEGKGRQEEVGVLKVMRGQPRRSSGRSQEQRGPEKLLHGVWSMEGEEMRLGEREGVWVLKKARAAGVRGNSMHTCSMPTCHNSGARDKRFTTNRRVGTAPECP
jgi:hypothetical protein